MNIGALGWMLAERLLWASLALAIGFVAAFAVSRLPFVAPTTKAWAWRLVLLQGGMIVLFNLGVGIDVMSIPSTQGSASTNVNHLFNAAGAGLAAFWLVPACALLFGLARSAWQTRRMLLELPSMPRPLEADPGTASYRLMRELSCPVVALCPGPVIAAPEWCWHHTAQARLALAHEQAHLNRGDVVWQMLGSVVAGMFWFHPLAQMAMKELGFWQECAADAAAIKMIDCEHHDYATAIVDIVAGIRDPQIPMAIGLGMQARQLGRRLEVAVDGERSRPWLGAFVAVIIIVPALVPWRASAARVIEAGDEAAATGSVDYGRVAAPLPGGPEGSPRAYSPSGFAAGG